MAAVKYYGHGAGRAPPRLQVILTGSDGNADDGEWEIGADDGAGGWQGHMVPVIQRGGEDAGDREGRAEVMERVAEEESATTPARCRWLWVVGGGALLYHESR